MSEHLPASQSDRSPEGPIEPTGGAPSVVQGQAHEEGEATRPRPAIWLGSLLDYNNGVLHGRWIDADQTVDALVTAAQSVLASSPTMERSGEAAEEWAIFDHKNFGLWSPGEHEDLARVSEIATGIAQHGPAYAVWANEERQDSASPDQFEQAFLGSFDSPEQWAEQFMDDTGVSAALEQLLQHSLGHLLPYVQIDLAGWVRDAQLSGDITVHDRPDGGVWIFRNDQ